MSNGPLENWLLSKFKKNKVTEKSLDDLSLLTVVIPSYGRQEFLLRQCAYWHGSGAVVLVVDGSPEPLGERIRHMLSALGDIKYIHSHTNLMERLNQASKLIDTPYTVMLGDDEFFLISGLRKAINLLENDQELVACIGQSLHYYLSDNGSKFSYGLGYDTYKYEIRHDRAQDRLNSAMTSYNAATCYAVTRSPIWSKSWGSLQEFSSAYVCELEHSFVTYIWGKLGSVDDVYWMRSSENPPTSTSDINRNLSADDWWMSNKFKNERKIFINKLSDELISAQKIDRAKAEYIVRNAFDVYLRDVNYPASSSAIRKCRRFVVLALKKCLPQIWIGYLKRLRFRSNPATKKALATGNFGALSDLMATKTPLPFRLSDELFADLSAMEKLIAEFYSVRSVQSK